MDQSPESTEPEIVSREEVPAAVVRATLRMEELPQLFDRAYRLVASVLEQQRLEPGEAFARYLTMPGETMEVEAGFTTTGPVEPEEDVVPTTLPAGEVARLTHTGPYDTLSSSWDRLGRWIGDQGRRPGAALWEVYVTEPTPEADPATMRTDLYWPLEG